MGFIKDETRCHPINDVYDVFPTRLKLECITVVWGFYARCKKHELYPRRVYACLYCDARFRVECSERPYYRNIFPSSTRL